LDPAMDDESFVRLEAEFKETLEQLVGGEGCSIYALKDHYIKMHKALVACHANERRLMRTCRDLNKEIQTNSSKVKDALKLSQQDQNVVGQLKQEIDAAWKNSDQAQDKDCRARETVQSLKQEIINMNKMAERGAAAAGSTGSGDKDAKTAAMAEEMEEIKELLIMKDMEIGQLKTALESAENTAAELGETKQKDDRRIDELSHEVQLGKNELLREGRKKHRIESELKQTRETLHVVKDDLSSTAASLEAEKNIVASRDGEIRSLKISQELQKKEERKLREQISTLQGEVEGLKVENQDARGEIEGLQMRQKSATEEIHSLRADIARQKKSSDAMIKKVRFQEEALDASHKEKDTLQSRINAVSLDLDKEKKEGERLHKEIAEMKRDRDKMLTNMQKQEANVEKLEGIIKMDTQYKKDLNKQIDKFKEDLKKSKFSIHSLEKDRDRLITISGEKDSRIMNEMEVTKKQELQLFDYKKQVTENATKLKQQENLFEAARQEKNEYAKNLVETKDMLAQYKKKCELTLHESDQLKEELVREHNRKDDLRKSLRLSEEAKNRIQSEANRLRVEVEQMEIKLKAAEESEKFAQKIILEKEGERVRMKKEFDKLVSERDLVGTQLVRRNDEMACLNEKLKLQNTRMGCGEVHYNSRVKDIQVLRRENKEMQRQNKLLTEKSEDRDSLLKETCRLNTELSTERLRVKKLEETVETPQNVHRFRLLCAKEPTTEELLQKIDTLERRVLKKTEEVEKREAVIEDLQRQIGELQRTVDRLPGPKEAEALAAAKRVVKEKSERNVSLEVQLKMLYAERKQRQNEQAVWEKQLNDARRDYLNVKTNLQKEQQERRELQKAYRRFSQEAELTTKLPEIEKNA